MTCPDCKQIIIDGVCACNKQIQDDGAILRRIKAKRESAKAVAARGTALEKETEP